MVCPGGTGTVIRLLCRECRRVSEESVDARGQLYVAKHVPATRELVCLEQVALCVLHCQDVGEGYSLRPAL